MLKLWSLCVFAATALAAQAPERAQMAAPAFGAVDGLVADSSLTPIDGALIELVATSIQVRTATSGRFRVVKLPVGAYRLLVRKPGYEAISDVVEVRENDTSRVTYVLHTTTVTLDTSFSTAIRPTDRLQGFADRLQHSIGGHFITQAEIEKQSPTEITDLLRRISGLSVVDSNHVLVAISNRGRKTSVIKGNLVSVPCIMPVMVDGFLTDSRFPINSISPNSVYGIEIYVGPSSMPPQFNGARTDTFCGLIVIWTKSG